MKYLIIFFCTGFLFSEAFGQWSAGTYYNHQQMLSSTSVSGAETSHGMAFAALYRLPSSKFSLGLEIAGSGYDHRHYGATILTDDYGLVSADVRETYGWMQASLLSRYHFLNDAVFEPYAEARLGYQQFFTARSASDGTALETGEQVMSACDMRGYIAPWETRSNHLVGGMGLGTIVNLKKLVCQTEENYGFEVKLDLGLTYLLSSQSKVREMNEMAPQQLMSRSQVNAMLFRAGLLVAF
ncbi:MAG: hypothetical protein EA392_00565 [Cryomorphaceae bacterium]|nr:MAG: hypothetical protein EA392_00565 [Cryomorphaceae bacterium]